MIRLFLKVTLVVIIALAGAYVLDYFYRKSYKIPFSIAKNILILPEIRNKYEIVKLGNSHSADGVTFEKYRARTLDLSSVAQSFEYDLPMLKMYRKQIKKDAVILIHVSAMSFSQKKPKKEDNVNMNYYDGRLSPVLIPHLKIGEYFQIQIIPFLRSGYLWRQKNAKDIEAKSLQTFAAIWEKDEIKPTPIPSPTLSPEFRGTPNSGTNTRSYVPTFKVREILDELALPPDPKDNRLVGSSDFMANKWYSKDFGPEYFDTNRKDLEEIIAYCLKNNWHPVVFTLPMSQVLIDKMGPGYMNKYLYDQMSKVNLKGIQYYDFSRNKKLTQDRYLYSNSDHLNGRGAAIASYLLLQQLIKDGYLPKTADGYDYN